MGKSAYIPHEVSLHGLLVKVQDEIDSQEEWGDVDRIFVTSTGKSDEDIMHTFIVTYGDDDDGEQYAFIRDDNSTPINVYAEIEDGTYGELQGWRIYQ